MLGSHSIGREAKRNINDIRMDLYYSQNLQETQREIFKIIWKSNKTWNIQARDLKQSKQTKLASLLCFMLH